MAGARQNLVGSSSPGHLHFYQPLLGVLVVTHLSEGKMYQSMSPKTVIMGTLHRHRWTINQDRINPSRYNSAPNIIFRRFNHDKYHFHRVLNHHHKVACLPALKNILQVLHLLYRVYRTPAQLLIPTRRNLRVRSSRVRGVAIQYPPI